MSDTDESLMDDMDEDDERAVRTERSRTPRQGREQEDWIMMVEAEPSLVPVRQASTVQSAWVGEPKPFGKPERFATRIGVARLGQARFRRQDKELTGKSGLGELSQAFSVHLRKE